MLIKIILYIRLKQFLRFVKIVGLLRGLFLLGFLSFVGFILYNFISNPVNTNLICIVFSISLLALHLYRKDKHFLQLNFRYVSLVYLTEYLLLLSPLIVIFLYFGNLKGAGILFLSTLLIALLNFRSNLIPLLYTLQFLIKPTKAFKHGLPVKVPINNPLLFEWISGIRRFGIVIAPIYLLVLAFSFRGYVGPIGVIVITIFTGSFFQYGEPRNFIEVFANNPHAFMHRKIWINAKIYLLMLAPIALISLIFQPENYYWILGSVLIALLFQSLAIIFKYGLFAENRDLSHNSLIIFLNMAFVLVPLFWPVPVFMSIKYYKKAIDKLKPYFHDID